MANRACWRCWKFRIRVTALAACACVVGLALVFLYGNPQWNRWIYVFRTWTLLDWSLHEPRFNSVYLALGIDAYSSPSEDYTGVWRRWGPNGLLSDETVVVNGRSTKYRLPDELGGWIDLPETRTAISYPSSIFSVYVTAQGDIIAGEFSDFGSRRLPAVRVHGDALERELKLRKNMCPFVYGVVGEVDVYADANAPYAAIVDIREQCRKTALPMKMAGASFDRSSLLPIYTFIRLLDFREMENSDMDHSILSIPARSDPTMPAAAVWEPSPILPILFAPDAPRFPPDEIAVLIAPAPDARWSDILRAAEDSAWRAKLPPGVSVQFYWPPLAPPERKSDNAPAIKQSLDETFEIKQ